MEKNMLFNICVFIIVVAGVWIGFNLIRNKKYKYGVPIIISSFAVLGGLDFLNNMSITINNTNREMDGLKINMTQALSLNQNISNTVNLVTKVEKEIANIKEAIHQQYASFNTELFWRIDLGKRIAIYKNPKNPEKNSVIFIELPKIPEKNSIQIADNTGSYAPPSSYEVTSNIIAIGKGGMTPDAFLKNNNEYYAVKYIPDTISSDKMLTIKDLQLTLNEDGNLRYSYKYK